MIAVIVNALAVFLGSLLGIGLGSRFKESLRLSLVKVLGLSTIIIAVSSAIKSADIMCLIICSIIGTAIGEAINIDKAIEKLGDGILKLAPKSSRSSRFTEGFIAASTLYCIGSMTIIGSLEAGVNHNYSIIFAKSALDFVSSIAFGAAMGWGVCCSALFVLVFQAALTLLASFLSPYLSPELILEMSAVGGLILLSIGINMLDLGKEPIKGANMLPALFLPAIYIPVSEFIRAVI